MFHHMVMFTFPDEEVAAAVEELLEGLADALPQVQDLVIGRDELRSARSFDVGMLMTFADREAFESYDADPVHRDAARWIDGVSTAAIAVDWED